MRRFRLQLLVFQARDDRFGSFIKARRTKSAEIIFRATTATTACCRASSPIGYLPARSNTTVDERIDLDQRSYDARIRLRPEPRLSLLQTLHARWSNCLLSVAIIIFARDDLKVGGLAWRSVPPTPPGRSRRRHCKWSHMIGSVVQRYQL